VFKASEGMENLVLIRQAESNVKGTKPNLGTDTLMFFIAVDED